MPNNTPNQSVQRTVQILYLLAGQEGGLSVRQIADQIKTKPNTAYRLIRSMELEKLVERRTEPIRFILGPAVAQLYHLNQERHLLSEADRLLRYYQTQQRRASFVFSEMEGTKFYTRLRTPRERPGVLIRHRESVNALYETSSSLLFMAYANPLLLSKIEQSYPFEEYGSLYWKSRAELNECLRLTRKRGYCFPQSHGPLGTLITLSAPVFDSGNEIIAAVGGYISDEPVSQREIKRLIENCCKCAHQLTELSQT
ncbi:helix-turn-helix domain-containing protein [Coraliomargarita algicola]|uniref:Helix-turn-helix domain-containing protein n=1 Tax=Coraliomargarita algicola TaxID=3092156 RepID=A0ABZ0RKM8_9BACT|nr:IclR family transcriptional regulator C-terminal domain-containing protein [Coraliomargarita sp. J2-16]WPJ96761.1 helix-turn-helix domain-containing protein [Coraliomargarita sp. J2-16]